MRRKKMTYGSSEELSFLTKSSVSTAAPKRSISHRIKSCTSTGLISEMLILSLTSDMKSAFTGSYMTRDI